MKLICTLITKINKEIDCFVVGPEIEADRVASTKTTQMMHNDDSDVFKGIGCFKGMFSLQIKDDVKPYQALPKGVAYALQGPFKMELE